MMQLDVNSIFVLATKFVVVYFSTVADGLTDFACCRPHTVRLHEAQHTYYAKKKRPNPALSIALSPAGMV
jgi:hypothetical protein